jgi:hypothetical protein
MRKVYLIPVALAAVIAGTSVASAQAFRDDPPGWSWQKRGIIDSNGYDPQNYGRYGYYGRSPGNWRGNYYARPGWNDDYARAYRGPYREWQYDRGY